MYKLKPLADESVTFYKEAVGSIPSSLVPFPIPFAYETQTNPYEFQNYFSVPSEPVIDISSLPLVLKVADISRITGLSRQTCYRMCQSDDFPAFKMPGSAIYMIPRDKFFDWLNREADKPLS